MKIILIGNFGVPFSTESDLAWSYEKLGHEVSRMQENQARTEKIWMDAKRGADIVHYVHTHGWDTPGRLTISRLFEMLHERGIPTISTHLDYWRGLEREKDVNQHPFWHTKYVFTADGGSHEWYRKQGINHFWLKPGVVERECFIGTERPKYKTDVVFVGSYGYHPEWPYRPQLIDWLKKTYGPRFAHYGGGGLPTIRGNDLNDLYASAKVVVGDSLCLNFEHTHYWSDRIYETTGRGGFIIHPYIEGIESQFTDKKDVVFYEYQDFKHLKEQIDYYLENPKEREAIKLSGHERTKHNYTYTHRMLEVINILAEREPQIKAKVGIGG